MNTGVRTWSGGECGCGRAVIINGAPTCGDAWVSGDSWFNDSLFDRQAIAPVTQHSHRFAVRQEEIQRRYAHPDRATRLHIHRREDGRSSTLRRTRGQDGDTTPAAPRASVGESNCQHILPNLDICRYGFYFKGQGIHTASALYTMAQTQSDIEFERQPWL